VAGEATIEVPVAEETVVEVVQTPEETVVAEATVVVATTDPAIEAVVERDVVQAAEANEIAPNETEA